MFSVDKKVAGVPSTRLGCIFHGRGTLPQTCNIFLFLLQFLAPEYLNNGINCVTTAADVFSLGALICWIYAGHLVPTGGIIMYSISISSKHKFQMADG
jgi:hypothetical protein